MLIAALFGVIGMILAAGLLYQLRSKSMKIFVGVMISVMAWAIHYRVVLANTPLLLDEKKPHIIYTAILIVVIPVLLLGISICGFYRRQREYMEQYRNLDM